MSCVRRGAAAGGARAEPAASTSPASRRRPTSPALHHCDSAIRSVSRRCRRTCSTIMRPTTSTSQAQAGGGGARRRDQVLPRGPQRDPVGEGQHRPGDLPALRRPRPARRRGLLCQITYKPEDRSCQDPHGCIPKFVPSGVATVAELQGKGSPISRSDEPRVDERTRQCRASPYGWGIDPDALAHSAREASARSSRRPAHETRLMIFASGRRREIGQRDRAGAWAATAGGAQQLARCAATTWWKRAATARTSTTSLARTEVREIIEALHRSSAARRAGGRAVVGIAAAAVIAAAADL